MTDAVKTCSFSTVDVVRAGREKGKQSRSNVNRLERLAFEAMSRWHFRGRISGKSKMRLILTILIAFQTLLLLLMAFESFQEFPSAAFPSVQISNRSRSIGDISNTTIPFVEHLKVLTVSEWNMNEMATSNEMPVAEALVSK